MVTRHVADGNIDRAVSAAVVCGYENCLSADMRWSGDDGNPKPVFQVCVRACSDTLRGECVRLTCRVACSMFRRYEGKVCRWSIAAHASCSWLVDASKRHRNGCSFGTDNWPVLGKRSRVEASSVPLRVHEAVESRRGDLPRTSCWLRRTATTARRGVLAAAGRNASSFGEGVRLTPFLLSVNCRITDLKWSATSCTRTTLNLRGQSCSSDIRISSASCSEPLTRR